MEDDEKNSSNIFRRQKELCTRMIKKENCVFQHFSNRLGMQQNREVSVDWDVIQLPSRELQHLEEEFTEEEVRAVVQELASEKAPGPDGFIGLFYKTCWETIKEDVLAAINYYARHDQHFNLLDTAHIVLLPKNDDASMVGDYRPIILSHSITKLISKILAGRLSAELDSLVSRAQSAFIKKNEYPRQLLVHAKPDKGVTQSREANFVS